jgi:raffinose/stachyose/melibiose transport system substrate-binding protein
MYRKLLIGVLATALAVTVATAAIAASTSRKTTQLTLWHNYGTEGNAVATNNLVKAFEKLHPDIKIRVVSQPADNYFALLQSSAISHTSPDLATMWTGLFDLKYAKFLLNLKPYFSPAETKKLSGISYMAPDFKTSNGFLVMPLENQF